MRQAIALAALSSSVALMWACAAAPAFTPQDEAAVRVPFDSTPAFIMRGDWARWAAQFAEHSFIQPPNAPAVTGRDAVQKWGEAFPRIDSLTFSNVQITGDGNMAYGTSGYMLKFKDPAMPNDVGKQLCVFRKTAGTWEGMGCSFNSDLPLPAPAPAAAPGKKME